MRTLVLALLVGIWAGGFCPAAAAQEAPAPSAVLLGAPDFKPSPAQPIGWRGDWTGRYPGATPPITWGRQPPFVKDLRYQATAPRDGDERSAAPVELGAIRSWLIAGPFAADDPAKALEQAPLGDETALAPAMGDKAADKTWNAFQRIGPNEHYIGLTKLLGKGPGQVAYAAVNLYSPAGGKCQLAITHDGGMKAFVNGKQVYADAKPAPGMEDASFGRRVPIELQKGWNRLLLKIASSEKNWQFGAKLLPPRGAEYESTNIRYRVLLPGWADYWCAGAPVVVGERLFLMTQPGGDLVCLNKADGRIAWIRSSTWADVATDEQRATAAYKEQVEPALAKIAALQNELIPALNALTEHPAADGKAAACKKLRQLKDLERPLFQKMKAVDAKAFDCSMWQQEEASATPVTDGTHVFVWLADSGLAACYDLDGRRQWITLTGRGGGEHGSHGSPVLIGDKLCVANGMSVWALDSASGKILWQQKFNHNTSDTGSLSSLVHEGKPYVVVTGSGFNAAKDILSAADGKLLYKHPQDSWDTSVYENDTLYFIHRGTGGSLFGLSALKLPTAEQKARVLYRVDVPLEAYLKPIGAQTDLAWCSFYIASPLLVDNLAYMVSEGGILTVADTATGKPFYTKTLDFHLRQAYCTFPGICASPTLAGGNVYLLGDMGVTHVLTPGQEHKELARNFIESLVHEEAVAQEQFLANPVFDGGRIFIRGQEYLYCIEAPPAAPAQAADGR